MSKLANKPIAIPDGAEVTLDGRAVRVRGPLGELELELEECKVAIERSDAGLRLSTDSAERRDRSLLGTYWRRIRNMLTGVTEGFRAELELVGVGYRARAEDGRITLSLGYSQPVVRGFPDGVRAETPTQTEIVVSGIDKAAVGRFADEIRHVRPVEPYKGKGVRRKGERVVLKETKKK